MLAHVACPRFAPCPHTVTSSLAIMPTQRLPQPRPQRNLWYATQPHAHSARTTRLNPVPNLRLRQATSSSASPILLCPLTCVNPPGFTCPHAMWITVVGPPCAPPRLSRIGCCGGHRLGVRCSCFACEVRTCPQPPVRTGVRLQAVPGVARRVTSRHPSRYGSPEHPQSSPNLSTALWIGGAEARAVGLSTLYREIRVN